MWGQAPGAGFEMVTFSTFLAGCGVGGGICCPSRVPQPCGDKASVKTYRRQVEKEWRCRGCFGVSTRFGESAETVVLIEMNDGIVRIHRYEATPCPVVGQEKPFDEIECAGTYPALLEFALHS